MKSIERLRAVTICVLIAPFIIHFVLLAMYLSPLYAKGDPVFRVLRGGPKILVFWTPKTPQPKPPGQKQIWENKGIKTTLQKKSWAHPFVLARWRQKKKSGSSRRKFPGLQVFSEVLGSPLPTEFRGKTSSDLRPGAPPFASCFVIGFISDPGFGSLNLCTL